MKPGYKTTEFWLTLIAAIQPFIGEPVSRDKASAIAVLAVGLYSIARGIAKARKET
jgi:hypothetical protein